MSWDPDFEPMGYRLVRALPQLRFVTLWVAQDRVVSGVQSIPDVGDVTAVLLFARPAAKEIEMATVGVRRLNSRLRQ